MSSKPTRRDAEIPDIVTDTGKGKRYMKGRFLGKVCIATIGLDPIN